MEKNIFNLLDIIAQTIYDKKGFNILAIDVKNISSMTDYVIIAEGNVDRHVKGIASFVIEEMQRKNQHLFYKEGMESGDWIVLDYLDIMVHLFMPGLREKYQLEELLREGQIIDLNIQIKEEK